VTLESLEKAIAELSPHGMVEKNLEAAERAFAEVSQLFKGGDQDA
jgi:Pyruvate/2-oxoacid:ferredoxin oxidoreductase gamma subunit